MSIDESILDDKGLLAAVAAGLNASQPGEPPETEASFAQVQARIRDHHITTPERRNIYAWRYVFVTASLFAIVIAYIWGGSRTAPTTSGIPQTYTTRSGQRTTITLSDGSTAILAPVTRLIVIGCNVELQGEAVFTVNQHNGNPFTVKSGNTITRVLGTKFGIRAYDDHIRIAVSQGKISISNTSHMPRRGINDLAQVDRRAKHGGRPGYDGSQILIPGDIAEISNARTTIHHNRDVSELMAWTRGNLVLRDIPVPTAIQELNRWYDVDVRVANPALLTRHLTITLPTRLTDDVLKDIAEPLGAGVERNGRGGRGVTLK